MGIKNLVNKLRHKSNDEITEFLDTNYYKYLFKKINKFKRKSLNQILFLAYYYQYIEKNYGEAKIYYLMATDNGDTIAMNNYNNIFKIYENFKIYDNTLEENKLTTIKNIEDFYIDYDNIFLD